MGAALRSAGHGRCPRSQAWPITATLMRIGMQSGQAMMMIKPGETDMLTITSIAEIEPVRAGNPHLVEYRRQLCESRCYHWRRATLCDRSLSRQWAGLRIRLANGRANPGRL